MKRNQSPLEILKYEQTYRVEIRSLAEPINSCNCPDHRINGLGTCKHIEALVPMHEAVETALQALVLWQGRDADTPPALGQIDTLLIKFNLLPPETLSLVAHLREDQAERDEAHLSKLLAQSDSLLPHAASVLASAGGD